jgi:subtilisin family serine protease
MAAEWRCPYDVMMRGVRAGLAALGFVLAVLPGTSTAAATAGPGAGPRRAVVLLDPGPRPAGAHASAAAVAARHGLRRARPDVPEVGVMTVRVPAGTSFRRFAARLERDRGVRRVEPEARHRFRLLPDDPAANWQDPLASPSLPYQWYLTREGFPAAWDLTHGDGVRIGIVDSGIDSTHPDFNGKIALARDQDAGPGGTTDQVGHGTHVAGLACATTNNGVGIAGTGFNCQLIAERSDLSSSSVIASLVDATDNGARVINMSFGGGRLTYGELRALRYAFRHDVVLIAAAADTPTVEQGHPAKDLQPTGTGPVLDEGDGLVVTAADLTGGRASFAGRGSQISIAAYGDTGPGGAPGIFSTYPGNPTQIESGNTSPPSAPCPSCRSALAGDNRYGYLSGTSMAAPQVAGAAALVRAANPKLSNISVIRVLKETALRTRGWTNDLGWGIVNAAAAVRRALALAADTVPPRTKPRGGRRRQSGRRFTLRWRARDTAGTGVAAAGVEAYRVYARRGHGAYHLEVVTRSRAARFVGRHGARYSFYIQARDRAGNLERPPHSADFVIRIRN